MRRNGMYVVLILVLVVILVVLSIFLFFRPKDSAPEPTPTINVPVTETPSAPPAVVSTPEPTPEPTPSPTPAPTPEPVIETRPPETPAPMPTPEPTPTFTPSASGSFGSNTGVGLNIRVDWRTYTDGAGARKLQVDVSALSYSCFTSALWHGVEITVNGQTYAADTPAINYDGKGQITTALGSFTIDAPDSPASLSAVWHYRGTYSGQELEDITATGTVG